MTLKKFKSNIISPLDFCVLLIVVFILLGGFFKLYNRHLFMLFNKSEKAYVSVIVPISETLKESEIKKGQVVALESGEVFGTVTDVINVKEKRYSAINQTLFYDYTEKTTSVIIKVEAKIKKNDSRPYINNTICVSPGNFINIRMNELGVITGQVDSIEYEKN